MRREPDAAPERDVVSEREGTDAKEPSARLFVGVRPPSDVVTVLAALDRPALDEVRWTAPDQWHVTLAFLGNVTLSRRDAVESALVEATARAAGPSEAHLGPSTRRVRRSILCVPVEGLDGLAGLVRRALVAVLPDAGLDEPFHGHLTLARARGRRAVPSALLDVPVEARWPVREVHLVRSELDRSGARHTTLVTATVGS